MVSARGLYAAASRPSRFSANVRTTSDTRDNACSSRRRSSSTAIRPSAIAAPGCAATLQVPTLIVWGSADPAFGRKWAYELRDLIPGARDVIEVEGAKVFFPGERPGDLVPHLRHHWGR